jgi:hypothetical protein
MLIGHLGDEIKMHFDGGKFIDSTMTNEVYINKTTNEKSLLQSGIT